MPEFAIQTLPLGAGGLGISPMPGRYSPFAEDLKAVRDWGASMVITMTGLEELARCGAGGIGVALDQIGIAWRHMPVGDFGVPGAADSGTWSGISADARAILGKGGRVLAHCYGGCGRSGMALLRLMVETGEEGSAALTRLRVVRPCAVETEAQRDWAFSGSLA